MTAFILGYAFGLICAALFPAWTARHGAAPALVILARLAREKRQCDRNSAILLALQSNPVGHGERLRMIAQQEHELGMHGDLPVPYARCVECEYVAGGGLCTCTECSVRQFTRDDALVIVLADLRSVGMGWEDLAKCEAHYGVSLRST